MAPQVLTDDEGYFDAADVDAFAQAGIHVQRSHTPPANTELTAVASECATQREQIRQKTTGADEHPKMPAYLTQNWPDEDRINAILDESEQPPTDPDRVLALLRQRFACIFGKLPADMRVHPEILHEAVTQSAGHALDHVPETARQNLSRAFFLHAIEDGAAGWIIRYGSDAVKRDKAIQIAAIESHPAAIDFVLDPDEEVRATIALLIKNSQQNGERRNTLPA